MVSHSFSIKNLFVFCGPSNCLHIFCVRKKRKLQSRHDAVCFLVLLCVFNANHSNLLQFVEFANNFDCFCCASQHFVLFVLKVRFCANGNQNVCHKSKHFLFASYFLSFSFFCNFIHSLSVYFFDISVSNKLIGKCCTLLHPFKHHFISVSFSPFVFLLFVVVGFLLSFTLFVTLFVL